MRIHLISSTGRLENSYLRWLSNSSTVQPSSALLLGRGALSSWNPLGSNEANQSSIFPVNAEVSYIQYISIPAGTSLIVHFDSFAGLLSP